MRRVFLSCLSTDEGLGAERLSHLLKILVNGKPASETALTRNCIYPLSPQNRSLRRRRCPGARESRRVPGVGRREKRLQRGLCAREGQAGDWFTYFMKRIFMFRGGLCLMGDATREQIQSHKIR